MTLSVIRRMPMRALRLKLVTAPAAEPITKALAKAHLKVDASDEDDLITQLTIAVRNVCEDYLGRALITQTWQLFMDAFPGAEDVPLWEGTRIGPETILGGSAGSFELPKPPLVSVTHIKTYDDADADTTFASSNYYVDIATEPGRIVLRSGSSWPTPTRVANGIEVQFVAGYGAAGTDIEDENILQGMYLLLGHLYENRESTVVGVTASTLPFGVAAMWGSRRVMTL